MARKKKAKVDRCDVCGVVATQHVAGDLSVCNNSVCMDITLAKIKDAVDAGKSETNGVNNE